MSTRVYIPFLYCYLSISYYTSLKISKQNIKSILLCHHSSKFYCFVIRRQFVAFFYELLPVQIVFTRKTSMNTRVNPCSIYSVVIGNTNFIVKIDEQLVSKAFGYYYRAVNRITVKDTVNSFARSHTAVIVSVCGC